MHQELFEFLEILTAERRFEALQYILNLLDQKKYHFTKIYEEILTPALNGMQASGDENRDIWNEHIRTSIIKTIIENIYPYVISDRNLRSVTQGKQVVILTPPDEFHTIGARMVKDVFTYLGYDAIFVGANTPFRVLASGLLSRQIDYVAISITNPYHLVSTRNMIESIRQLNQNVQIIVGGHAIQKLGEKVALLRADFIMTDFESLKRLEGEQL